MRFIGVSISDLTQGEIINGIYILRKKELKRQLTKTIYRHGINR